MFSNIGTHKDSKLPDPPKIETSLLGMQENICMVVGSGPYGKVLQIKEQML